MTRNEDGFIKLTPKKYAIGLQIAPVKEGKIIFRHGHIAICNYHMGDNVEFEKSLSVWDEIYFKYRLIGGYYIKRLKEFRINRAYDIHMLVKFFPNHKLEVENDAYPADKVKMKLMVAPRSDFQRVGLTFMTGQGEFAANLNFTQQMIDADTGEGKTYLGTAVCAFYQSRAVIIVPIAKLMGQWKESFVNFTSLEESDILCVQGSEMCKKIIAGKYKDKKIFIIMLDTIQSFNKRFGDMETVELMRSMNAYIKICDEIHKDMKSITMIEALSNFRMNFYMSASPGRSDKKENWIFKTLFHNIPRFGGNFKKQEERHINVMVKYYKFLPEQQQIRKMVNARKGWLNPKAYEEQLISAPSYQRGNFEGALEGMLRWSKPLIKPGNKILILVNTINGTEYIKSLAERVFPGQCSRYYGGLPSKEDKAKALEADVIVATASSLGTGADIKGIQHVYNITTYSNWIDATQLPGRARKIEGVEVAYIELVNVGWRKTYSQYEKRRPYLAKKAKHGRILVVQ